MTREYRIHVKGSNDYFELDKCLTTWGSGKYSAGERLAQEIADAYSIPDDVTIRLRMSLPESPRKRWSEHIHGPAY